jgi:hypothetical protein
MIFRVLYGEGKTEGVEECGVGLGSAVLAEGVPDWIGRPSQQVRQALFSVVPGLWP